MRIIPDSELVLNADGSIYHLGLHPEQLALTILTVGDPGRVERISKHFDKLEFKKQKREFLTHTGTLDDKRLSVISTGIGPDNIDIVINEVDALVNIDLKTRTVLPEKTILNIIRVGTSGGLQADIPVGSLVAAGFGLGFDNLFHFYEHRPTGREESLKKAILQHHLATVKLPVVPSLFEGSRVLLESIGKNMEQGITITAPGFYGPQGRNLRLVSRMSPKLLQAIGSFQNEGQRFLNFEMETAAIYGLSRLLGHRALSCNTILANRPAKTFTRNPGKAVDALIEEVLQRISGSDIC